VFFFRRVSRLQGLWRSECCVLSLPHVPLRTCASSSRYGMFLGACLVLLSLHACGPGEDPSSGDPSGDPSPDPNPEPSPAETPEVTPTLIPTRAYWEDGVMLVSDINGPRISVIRMSDGANIWEYNLFDHHPSQCDPTRDEPCLAWYAEHVVWDDRDYVDFLMNTNFEEMPHMASIHRVALDAPEETVFSMDGLDFSGLEYAGCTSTSELTCNQADAATLDEPCSLRFSHSMIRIADDPAAKTASFIVADTLNFRVLQVSLDYSEGGRCGTVDWVLDGSTPGFESTCPANSVQLLENGGERYLLVTCRNLFWSAGKGQIELFREDPTGEASPWALVWRYPEPDDFEEDAYVNAPHHGRLFELGDGSFQLEYAHSDGLGDDWGEGDRGTIGEAYLATLESPPDYGVDEWIGPSLDEPLLGFLRSVELLPGGERLVADSLTFISTPGALEGVVYLLEPGSPVDSARGGYWREDFSQQELREVGDQILRSYRCHWTELFVALWLDPDDWGSTLRSLSTGEGAACVENSGG